LKEEKCVENNSEYEETVHDDGEETVTEIDEQVISDGELGTVESLENEEEEDELENNPALVINVQSWATPIIGLVMLVVGLVGGYLLYPEISARIMGNTSTAVSPTAVVPVADSAAGPEPSAASREELMAFLIDQTRHFQGNAEAAVTIIEFSDFQ
jgi:xanthosine utilization system XapX-like protein